MTKLVVGLGNPGPEYEWTRHNVGFLVIDRIALHEGLLFHPGRALNDYRGPRSFQWARSEAPEVLYLKPETYMNRSGEVVAPIARHLDAAPEEILVVYDDLDLDVGRLRIRPHGGAGGQKGMRSIIDSLGTDRFPRLRVGIGRPRTDAARHVLETPTGAEREEMEISVAEAAEAILAWALSDDLEGCMTRFHSRWNEQA